MLTGGALAFGAAGLASGVLDDALDPDPEVPSNTDTPENKRKMLLYEQHQRDELSREMSPDYPSY
jgi:hypothetical protein